MERPRRTLGDLATLALVIFTLATLPGAALAQERQIGDAEADAMVAEIEAQALEATAALEELVSTRVDSDAIIETIGTEPEAIRDWVAEETRWVPYVGALRGPDGMLMDRMGSGLDRALLLADLLAHAGHEKLTLERTALPAGLAERLAHDALASPLPTGIDEPIAESLERGESVNAAAHDLIRLLDLDGRLQVEPETTAAEAMADHWWVRLDDSGDAIDLDPLFGDEAGERPAATESMTPDALPDELRHSVGIRVIIERLDADGLDEEVALERRILLGDPAVRALDLRFDFAFDDDARPGEDATTLDVATAATFWRPQLSVDDVTYAGEWFGTDGLLGPPEAPAAATSLGSAASALGALGGDGEDDQEAGSLLTAAWIEFASEGPGRSSWVERRELFDAIADQRDARSAPIDVSAAASVADRTRTGLALLSDTAILLLGASLDPWTVQEAYYQDVIDSRSGRIAASFMAAGREDERIAPSLGSVRPRPIPLMILGQLRDWWSTDRGRTFVAEPTVLSSHLVLSTDDGGTLASLAADIVMNRVGVLEDGPDGALMRVRQGVLDTLIEDALLGDGAFPNVWDRFTLRGSDADEWLAIREPADIDAAASTIPVGERARLRTSVEDGHAALVAPSPSASGGVAYSDWWKLAPDGTTLGMGFRGWGSQVMERVGMRGGESVAAYNNRLLAMQICQRFGVAATILNVYLIQVELHRGAGMRLPRAPRQLYGSCPYPPR